MKPEDIGEKSFLSILGLREGSESFFEKNLFLVCLEEDNDSKKFPNFEKLYLDQ